MKSIAFLAFLMFTGCVITHGLEQIQHGYNLKVVICAQNMGKGGQIHEYAADTSKKCAEEVKARLANGKLSEEQYLIHVKQLGH